VVHRTVEHAANQKLDEGAAGTQWNRSQEKGNPFREQQANRRRERHEGTSQIQKDPSLVAALLAPKSTPSEQRGDLANQTSCQVFFAFCENISRAAGMPSAFVGGCECLNFSNSQMKSEEA